MQTLVALAAEPLATLVGSLWIGRLGSAELAACATATSIFNIGTKLLNVPLAAVTVSTVAHATALEASLRIPDDKVANSALMAPLP
jgi:Na+-driven multidrug efflux pump